MVSQWRGARHKLPDSGGYEAVLVAGTGLKACPANTD